MTEGKCMNLVNDFICSGGKHMNFPCPHKGNICNCPHSIPVTKEMAEQYNNNGYICIPVKEERK